MIFEICKKDYLWSHPQFLEWWGEWWSFVKKILVLGSIPHVGYDFEHLSQEKVKTKWQLHQKIACARERLMPCHFRLRFDCAQSMQSVKLCISMYWLSVTVFTCSAYVYAYNIWYNSRIALPYYFVRGSLYWRWDSIFKNFPHPTLNRPSCGSALAPATWNLFSLIVL